MENRFMKRGVGYCENADCEDFSKGVFLLNHGDSFYCPRCRVQGFVEKERGNTDNNYDLFREVHVHYNYDPLLKIYREIGIVRDESLPEATTNAYHLFSPLIKTENRALKVAEAVLANLNRYRGVLDGEGVPKTTEVILSWDDDLATFSGKLEKLSKEWESSGMMEGASTNGQAKEGRPSENPG